MSHQFREMNEGGQPDSENDMRISTHQLRTPPSIFEGSPKSRERKATSREGEADSDGGSTGDCPSGEGEPGEARERPASSRRTPSPGATGDRAYGESNPYWTADTVGLKPAAGGGKVYIAGISHDASLLMTLRARVSSPPHKQVVKAARSMAVGKLADRGTAIAGRMSKGGGAGSDRSDARSRATREQNPRGPSRSLVSRR